MDLVACFIVGLLFGTVIAVLLLRGQRQHYSQSLAERDRLISERDQALAEQTEARQQLAVRAEVLASQLSEQERRHQESLTAQQQRFDDTMARVTAQLKDATGEMLRQRHARDY